MKELVARMAFPLALVIGAALWIHGYDGVGDGFSAGAVTGLGAILQYASRDRSIAARMAGERWAWQLVAVGLLLAVAVALGPVFLGDATVTHAPRPRVTPASFGGLKAHTSLIFDLGVALAVHGGLVGTIGRLFPPTDELAP